MECWMPLHLKRVCRSFGVLLFAAQLCFVGNCLGQDNSLPEPLGSDANWSPVPSEQRALILDLLCNHTKGNYERIRTWDATYGVSVEQLLTEDYVVRQYGSVLPADDRTALTQKQEFTIRVVIDMASNRVFRATDTQAFVFLKRDSGQAVKIPNAVPVDERSIVAAEHFVHFAPKQVRSINEISDYPEAKRAAAAFRDPVEEAAAMDHSTLLDPRIFFGWSRDNPFWGAFSKFAAALKNDRDDTLKKQVDSALGVAKMMRPDGTWYRVQTKMGSMGLATSVWSPKAGYNPVSFILLADEAGMPPLMSLAWSWKAIDGIYVPFVFKEALYTGPNKMLSLKRDVTTKKCALNGPLSEKQFEYAALGLTNGNVVVDRIERMTYVWNNGETVALAAFGERFVPPVDRSTVIRWSLVAATVLLILILSVLILRRRMNPHAA
jgi:hypothetical protein